MKQHSWQWEASKSACIMINRNASVRNSEKSFTLPPIHGALPPTGIVHKSPNVVRRKMAGRPRLSQNARSRASAAPCQQARAGSNLEPAETRRLDRHSKARAAGYDGPARTPWSGRDFESVAFQTGLDRTAMADALRPYSVLPPIKTEITITRQEPSAAESKAPRTPLESVTLKGKRDSEKLTMGEKSRRESLRNVRPGSTLTLPKPRETSPTIIAFRKARRKTRRCAVCLENEPSLTDIAVRLKEIFLRRNMEEMYLI